VSLPPEGDAASAGGPSAVSAIVLAGGRSVRFGQDKLDVPVDGRRLLDRAILAVAAVAAEIVVAGPDRSPWPAVGAATMRAATMRAATIRAVADRDPFGGPLVALAGTLDVVRHPIAVVVAGDMPDLAPAVLRLLVDALAEDPDRDAVVLAGATEPGRPDRRQPLPMAIRVDAGRAGAAAALARGDRSLVRLLDRLRVAEIPLERWRALDPEGGSLRDVDRPDDLRHPKP
jgi:molybdopterin-guanine dinucleotide biosynthesis protein A